MHPLPLVFESEDASIDSRKMAYLTNYPVTVLYFQVIVQVQSLDKIKLSVSEPVMTISIKLLS